MYKKNVSFIILLRKLYNISGLFPSVILYTNIQIAKKEKKRKRAGFYQPTKRGCTKQSEIIHKKAMDAHYNIHIYVLYVYG